MKERLSQILKRGIYTVDAQVAQIRSILVVPPGWFSELRNSGLPVEILEVISCLAKDGKTMKTVLERLNGRRGGELIQSGDFDEESQDFLNLSALLSLILCRFNYNICPCMKVGVNLVLVGKGVMIAVELTLRGEIWRRSDFFGDLGDLMKSNGRIHFFWNKFEV
jgi:hypothetical protein